jgi:hypothetical protein
VFPVLIASLETNSSIVVFIVFADGTALLLVEIIDFTAVALSSAPESLVVPLLILAALEHTLDSIPQFLQLAPEAALVSVPRLPQVADDAARAVLKSLEFTTS